VVLLLVFIFGVTDTLLLPEPASAIFAATDGAFGYLAGTGEEVLMRQGEGWRRFTLPVRFRLPRRVLAHDGLCYILADRTLTLCELRTARVWTVAEDADDAVITGYGELWVRSDFTLSRVSALGRELERRTIMQTPQAMWMLEDSLYLTGVGALPPLPRWFERADTASHPLRGLILSASPAALAVSASAVYILIEPKKVIRIQGL